MNYFIFLLFWAVVWYVPIPPIGMKWENRSRITSLLLGLFLFFVIQLSTPPLSIFIYLLIFLRLFVAFIESGLSMKRVPIKAEEGHYEGYRSHKSVLLRITSKISPRVLGIFFLLYLIAISSTIIFWQVQRVANASYLSSFIIPTSGLPFNTEIPDNGVRLVTEELAVSIARRHMSEFGSNTQILGCHITRTPNGQLVWVAAIGSTNILAENYVKGFVIVDATDPITPPIIVRYELNIGENLWWDRNVNFRSYLNDISRSYGISYITWDFSTAEPVYVVTRYNFGFDLIRRYETPLMYDAHGNYYPQANSMPDLPQWISQVYDEQWLESMINEMGGFRRGEGFDYWAGGFLWIIPPSRERFEMTEDTRYIFDPENGDVVALICVNPVGNRRTLSGVFKATRNGIFFYDFRQANYISGMTAEDFVEGRLPKPASGIYDAEMPLLYPVGVAPGIYRLAWYVPIYWREGTGERDETIYLAGFAIVDAEEASKIVININSEGLTSEQLVRKTRRDFLKLFGVVTYLEFEAVVLGKYEYVEDGTTHMVLKLDSETSPWVEATPKDVPHLQWNELMATKAGDKVKMHIEKRGEKWVITYFDNLLI